MNDTLEAPVTLPELKPADRCDHPRCGAQAFVITRHQSGDLFHCGHHFNALPLDLQILAVVDTRHLINSKPSPSANAEGQEARR